ncbi:MAG: tRNA uridine-5-carboxymethylaminomethyl(34) synthesis GTPase MnmE [Bacilli bacterium]|nr:tRNA uridine-5-carboxymethylaminomethyl(34) synthesis GTPase MnmE [Bacilli bacterium]
MEDTIVAISTALGKSAISIIRVSGPEAIMIVNNIYKGINLETSSGNSINYGHIVVDDKTLDEVLVSVFRSPKSYTGEDIVEINCHGGIFVTNKVLEILIQKGCRPAEPGEFTKRAFLNGRIDLTQAESVMDLIEAKTLNSLKMANIGLRGDIRKMIEAFRNEVLEMILKIEVNIDYPEYEDEEQITNEHLKPVTKKLINKIETILEKSETSTILKEGIATAIIGPPNVGKSSLLNALIQEEKAIVTDIAGTTRDLVEGRVDIGGVVLNLVDTAGVRQTENVIERIGVEKSKQMINQADLVILVFDYSTPLNEIDGELLRITEAKNRIIVINKQDLKPRLDLKVFGDYLLMSTFNKDDIEKLKTKIKDVYHLSNLSDIDYTYISNARQIAKLKQTRTSLEEAYQGILSNYPIDIINIDLRQSWKLLGEIIGEVHSVDIVDELFANFCLGK